MQVNFRVWLPGTDSALVVASSGRSHCVQPAYNLMLTADETTVQPKAESYEPQFYPMIDTRGVRACWISVHIHPYMHLLWCTSCLALLHRCGLPERASRRRRLRTTSIAKLAGIPRGGCERATTSLINVQMQSLPIKSVAMQQRNSRRCCRPPLAMSFSGESRVRARARAGEG